MCDLKGAHRNRGGEDENDTVLDENLFRFNNGHPLLLSEVTFSQVVTSTRYPRIYPASQVAKQRLTRALHNDTLFLASINVMDYSLLVGMVKTNDGECVTVGRPGEARHGASSVVDGAGEEWTLMVGLIDYCRQVLRA